MVLPSRRYTVGMELIVGLELSDDHATRTGLVQLERGGYTASKGLNLITLL